MKLSLLCVLLMIRPHVAENDLTIFLELNIHHRAPREWFLLFGSWNQPYCSPVKIMSWFSVLFTTLFYFWATACKTIHSVTCEEVIFGFVVLFGIVATAVCRSGRFSVLKCFAFYVYGCFFFFLSVNDALMTDSWQNTPGFLPPCSIRSSTNETSLFFLNVPTNSSVHQLSLSLCYFLLWVFRKQGVMHDRCCFQYS